MGYSFGYDKLCYMRKQEHLNVTKTKSSLARDIHYRLSQQVRENSPLNEVCNRALRDPRLPASVFGGSYHRTFEFV